MQFLKEIQLIQGGMGVYVSNWRLARAVATERPGQTAGTVSGTALDVVYIEHHTAGGHNANPVGPLHLDALGQPILQPTG